MGSRTTSGPRVVDKEVESCDTIRPVLPLSFIDGLVGAVSSGMSPEQVVAIVGLAMDVWDLMDTFDRDTLMKHCNRVLPCIASSVKFPS
jgi:hypothetical protein